MMIWYRAKPGHATPFQTEDGKIKLWWRGVFGLQVGNWFFGAVNGYREMAEEREKED